VSTGLKWVSYSLGSANEGTNSKASGLVRSEEPCIEAVISAGLKRVDHVDGESEGKTNAPPTLAPEPVSEAIRFVHFRYWDGTSWAESWSGRQLPLGVEVTLANEAPEQASASEGEPIRKSATASTSSPRAAPAERPKGFFRRVIYLPAGVVAESAKSSTGSSGRSELPWEEMP